MRPKRYSRSALPREWTERGCRGGLLALGFLALALLAPAHARAQPRPDESSGPADRRSREQAILEALADTADTETAKPLVEQYLADYPSRPREQFASPELAAGELEAASSSLRAVLARGAGPGAGDGERRQALERFEAARDRLLAHFREVETRLRAAGIAGEIEARRAAAEAAVRARFETPGVGPLASLDSVAPEPPLLRSATLPYGRRDLAPRPPREVPAIVPSYAQIAPAEPGSAELAGSIEASLSPGILRQAEALAHDPVRIFELVRNEVRSELYAGSLRGAEGTLRAGSGNDVDQASLLIALLRSSGIPSRYVRGVAVHPVEELQTELRLSSATAVLEALRRAGLAHRPVIRGGRIAAVEVERTWVSAFVPYVNYRGTVIDFSGKTWIPLAPWAKTTAGSAPTAVLQAMGFSTDDFLAGYLGGPQNALPLALVRSAVEAHLASSAPGATYEGQLGGGTIVAEELGLLPSSLPFDVAAVTRESAALDETDHGTVRFVVRATQAEDSAPLLDATLPVAALAGQRVTLSYLPATVDDHRTVILWGGLGSVPAYLVDLRPVVRVAGRQAVVGEALPMGIAHRLELEISVPGTVETTSQTLLSGSYHALAIGAPTTVPAPDEGDDPSSSDSERLAARLLSSVAQRYASRWDAAENEIAGLHDLLWLRPIPAVAFASISFAVDTLFDLPWALRFEGVTLDAALRCAEPVARGNDAEAARAGLLLSGLQGSALEHAIFEELFLVDGLSADKGLGLARAGGIDVVVVDAGNVDSLLPTLAHPQRVLDEVRNWAVRGMDVAIPRAEIERNAWRGSAFRVEAPESGAAGYFISGGLAGGATTEAPENWVLQFLAAALAAPYTEPNLDALAGASIRKLEATDEQTGEVGELVGQPLAVEVRDIFGAPVAGAVVTFGSFSGGGTFVDDEGNESPFLAVPTSAQGVASARFRLGTNTAVEPVFRLKNPADTHTTRFGAHVVEATVATHEGDLALAQPFAAFAGPGPVTHLTRTNGSFDEPVDLAELAIWADSIFVEARDRFENSVANVAIDAAVEMVGSIPAECVHPVLDPQPAAVFARDQCVVPVPLLGECGGETASELTRAAGTQFGVIAPNEIRPFHVVLGAPAAPSVTQLYGILYDHVDPSEICTPHQAGVRIRTSVLSDELGNNIQAARPGETYGPVRFEVLLWDPYAGALCTNCDPCGPSSDGCHPGSPPAGGVWRRGVDGTLLEVEISPQLTVSNGGSASQPIQLEPGLFETLVSVGAAPGSNVVVADLEIQYNRCPQAVCAGSSTFPANWEDQLVTSIWGVLPAVAAVEPDPIRLDAADRIEAPVGIEYAIDPEPYHARSVEVILLADGDEVAGGHGTARQGSGRLDVQRGLEIDTDLDYAAQVVLNRGSAAEVRSDPFPLPLAQRLFDEVDESVVLSQDVDVVNQRVCSQPDQFHFVLTREATVTLEFFGVQAMAGGGYEDDGSHVTRIAAEVRAEGAHDIDVTPADLPPGRYRYVLRGVATGDGIAETREGFALSQYTSRDTLPIGHELVKGIDLFDGHLTLSREDFSIAGRGGSALALSFARTYSSAAGGEGGALGLGWSMNWGSKVIVTPCGEAIVVGGEGSGMRFVDDGAGGLRPLKGYHGSLVANADYSFDFFTKSGNRYHYLRTLGSEWELDTITDSNGNATRLLYEASAEAGERRVSAVVDDSGRTLRLHWEVRQFIFWRGEVIARVEGPLGIALSFEYDDFGNLLRAAREPHPGDGSSPAYAETYTYEIRPEQAFDDHHVLTEVEDEIRGATTLYTYEQGTIGVQGTVGVPRAFVTAVGEPEGGTTGFVYPLVILGSPGEQELDVEVTDRRGKLWRHRLNRYGAPIRREDPLGHVTLTTWTPDDVLVASRTDANEVVTSYTYDEHGNELTASVTVTDVDGVAHTYTTTTTYRPPATFDPPYIKDRPATRTDRNGHVTELAYDTHGNLLEQAITVRDVDGGSRRLATGQTFFPNGDLKTRTDPRGHLQSYSYDVHGNRTQRIDALNHPTTWDYDLRGRLTSETDARQHTTTFAYDTLDRRILVTFPEVDGDSATASVLYDDANRRRTEIDERGRPTTKSLDREGRVVSVDNAADGHKAFDYDDDGNKTRESSWFDATTARLDTTFVYDDAGRLIERHEPLGRTTVYAYDDAGNVVRETLSDALDPLFVPRVTESRYDALNRRIELTSHLGSERAVRQLLLDGEGNVLAEEDPLERRTAHRYDELQRRIETTAPEWRTGQAKVTQFLYDGNGNRIEERQRNERRTAGETWEAADQIHKWIFDDLDRVHQVVDAEEEVTTLDYDEVGNLTREISRRLAVTEHEYDARNRRRLTRQKLDRFTAPPRNVETEFDYDAVGNLAETRLPNGNAVTRQVDALNRPTGESDNLGSLSAATYDARGNPKTTTDANGNVTTHHYDALDRLIAQDLPEDRHVASTYDAAGNRLTATDARDNTTRYQYDQLNRLIQTTAPAPFSFTEHFSYDLAGNRLTATNRRDKTTTYDYDPLNRVTKITDPAPLSYERLFVYDAVGNAVSETDRRQIETQSTYDRENRRTSTRRAGIGLERVEYDEAGNRLFVTDANLNITGYQWDERNLLLQENRPLAAITKYRLDDMGDRLEATDPENKHSLFSYDLRRRLTSSTNGASETTAYCYDDNGNRTGMRHPKFAVSGDPCAAATGRWGYEYDDANRLAAVVDPLLHRTEYEYDANGNRTVQRDANTHTTGFAFDELDRLTAKTYPGGAPADVETYGYDENGNLTSLIDPKGQSFAFGYDALDRLTTETLPNPAPPTGDELEIRTTVYDPNGNVTRQDETYSTSGLAVETQTWDDFDRLLTKTDRHGETVSTTYDANGNRKTVRDSDSVVTSYNYDALNRLASQTGAGGVTTYDYFKNSLPKKTTYPNGASATQTYDLANRTQSITHRQNAALIASYVYAYDANGNRSEQVETNGGAPEATTYVYDDADRLTGVHYPDQTVTYTLDPVGNRETESIADAGGTPASAKTLAYDVRDRLLSVTDSVDPANNATLAWDENGNQIAKTQGSLVRGQIYDALDRLVEVQDNGLLLERYTYDPAGLRIRRAGPDGIFRFVRDDSAVLQQTDDAGITLARYEWGSDRLVSMQHATEGRSFSLFDGLGSVVAWSKTDGSLALRRSFDAWGTVRSETGESFAPFAFTGHELDEATGLTYSKARFLDTELGRFLTEDPFGGAADVPPSLHRFLYAYANPTAYVDPDGRANMTSSQALAPNLDFERMEEDLEKARQIAAHPRVQGALKVVGGTAEIAAGAAGLVAPEPTGLTKVAGVVAMAHGSDTFVSGAKQLISGRATDTVTKQVVTGGLEAAGVGESTANLVGDGVDVILGGAAAALSTRPAVGLATKVESIVLGESSSDIGVEAAEVNVRRSAPAMVAGETPLARLQGTFDDLADQHLLPQFRALDPNLKAGYTGSFRTGTVGNPNKATFGQSVNLNKFDVDYWIESDALFQKFGPNLKANPEFRKILSETPGFEGLKPNKEGFSIKFKPSGD